MNVTLPRYLKMMQTNAEDSLLRMEFFEIRQSKALKLNLRAVKPVLRFQDNDVHLGYTIGTRGNGVDQPRWPDDLSVEIVL